MRPELVQVVHVKKPSAVTWQADQINFSNDTFADTINTAYLNKFDKIFKIFFTIDYHPTVVILSYPIVPNLCFIAVGRHRRTVISTHTCTTHTHTHTCVYHTHTHTHTHMHVPHMFILIPKLMSRLGTCIGTSED